jgi:hypothetical protein
VTSSTNPAVPLPNFHDGIGAEELRREAARALHARFKQHVTETPATYNLGDVQLGSYRHKCRGRKDRPAANAPTKADPSPSPSRRVSARPAATWPATTSRSSSTPRSARPSKAG